MKVYYCIALFLVFCGYLNQCGAVTLVFKCSGCSSSFRTCSYCVYTGDIAKLCQRQCSTFPEKNSSCQTSNPPYNDSVSNSVEIEGGQGFSVGVLVGAMFGGVLLGFIVASCVFIYRWQKTKKELEKKDNVSQNCNQNSAYESEDYDQSDTMNKTPKTTKISQVNPIPRQQNTFTSHSTEDGVYNHLNESATSTTKTDDVYDHARLHSSTSVHCEGYGTLVFDHEGNEIYMKGDGKGAGCNVEKEIKNEHTAHNYFILEKETI